MTKKTKGKIASFSILVLLAFPLLYSFADFYWVNVKGVKDDTRNTNNFNLQNPFNNIKLGAILPSLESNQSDNSKKNQDLIYINSVTTSGAKNETAKTVIEGGGNQLTPNQNPPFKTKIIIRNQQAEALANNFLHLKNSYDVTLNKNTTTVFISGIDPRLIDDRSIAINYTLAKRLGLESKDAVYEATAVRKR
jgi:hypothetical protein